jgi:UDP-N-acetylmuramoyl-tripeptide--D-alanyl-D-alanine ligase
MTDPWKTTRVAGRKVWLRATSPFRSLLGRFRLFETRRGRRFCGNYIAVTGSCGKSTASELIARMLQGSGTVAHNQLFNSVRRVRRTLRKLRKPVDYVVQEVAAYRPGIIDIMLNGITVDVGVVTAVGQDHRSSYRREDMPVEDAIALEKGVLVERLAPSGVAVLNADDPRVRAMAARAKGRVVLYGCGPDAEVRAENVACRWPGRLGFDLVIGATRRRVETRFVGSLLLPSVLAALATLHGLGKDMDAAVAGLATIEPVIDRMGVHAGTDGKTYVLDTFKAPHWSILKLIEDLPAWGVGDAIFVLGDMSDMASENGRKYRQVMRALGPLVREVVATGDAARQVEGLVAAGMTNIVAAPTALDVARHLATRPPGLVILKANRTSETWRAFPSPVPLKVSHIGLLSG